MKVRKLAVALALAGTLGTGMAHAVGLGQIKLESYLNQPLKAQIKLLDAGDLSPDQIIVGLASNQDFSQAGIKRTYNLSNLKFKVVRDASGNMVVDVTTQKPVHEPFMDFLVDLNWPNGRVMREYTLLVDPPTYEKAESSQAVTEAGSSTPQQTTAAPASAESQTGATQATRAAGSPASGASNAGGGTYGPTKSNDTLWRIAERVKPNAQVTTQQEMLAIRDRNPDAFIDGNINRMKRGQVLRLPSLNQVESRSRHQAVREVISQNRAFKAMRQASQHPAVNATSAKGSGPGTAEVAQSGDQLKLVVANNGKETKNGSHGGGNGGTTETSLRNKLSVTQEQVDKLKRDNSDLNARLQDLQDQVKTLKRLVQLKSEQLSTLQVEAAKQQNKGATVSSGPQAAQPAVPSSAPAAATSAPQTGITSGASATSGSVAAPATSAPATTMAAATSKPVSSETATSQPMAAAKPGKTSQAMENSAPATQVATPKPREESKPQSTVAKLVQLVLSNRIYQIAAGGVGILILIGLWLLARRNAHHEKRFYDNLRDADQGEPIELGESEALEGHEGPQGEEGHEAGEAGGEDPLSEADVYIAYGRFDQATHLLEEAISAEPSRTDLRLKLLETYAESRNREAFGKQFRELEAMGDDESVAAAEALQSRLQEAEDVPSISDLESELKAGVQRDLDQPQTESGEESVPEAPVSGEAEDDDLGVEWDLDEFDKDFDEKPADSAAEAEEQPQSTDDLGEAVDFDLGDADLDEDAGAGEAGDVDLSDLSDELERSLSEDEEEGSFEAEDNGIEFSLDMDEAETDETAADLETSEDLESPADDESAEASGDLESIEFEPTGLSQVETEGDATADAGAETSDEPAADLEEPFAEGDHESPIDESFLDELDAELDKVTGESEPETADDASNVEEAESATQGQEEDALMSLAEEGASPESEGEPKDQTEAEEPENEDVLKDLELDVSDEDLAIMEEASQGDDAETDIPEVSDVKDLEAPEEASEETEVPSDETDSDLLDIDLDENEDALLEEGEALPDGEWDDLDLSDSDLGLGEDESELGETNLEVPESGSSAEEDGGMTEDWGDIDLEPDLGEEDLQAGDEQVAEEGAGGAEDLGAEPEDDDFDFLAGTDEAATKLDLARAYIEMGDSEGAKDILEEVSIEGNDEQKKEAQELLKSIS